MSRVIKEAVSDAISNRLQDPRIEGLVSVVKVEMPADLKTAEVYISIVGANEAAERKTFSAIEHAGRHIRSLVGDALTTRYCPYLHFHLDKSLKKTAETMRILDEISRERQDSEAEANEEF